MAREVAHRGAVEKHGESHHEQHDTVQLDAPLRHLMAMGRPSVADVVEVLRAYPMQRSAMMETIHRELGNSFANEVITLLQGGPTHAPVQSSPTAASSIFDLKQGPDIAVLVQHGMTYETVADRQISTVLGVLPGYVKARSALDRDAVQQLGMVVMSSLELLRAALAGLGDELHKPVAPARCAPGADAAAEMKAAADLARLDALRARHKELAAQATDVQVATLNTFTPREFRGHGLPDVVLPTPHHGPKGTFDVRGQVGEELVRTLTLLHAAERLALQFHEPKAAKDLNKRQQARSEIAQFAHRPADLMFLRAVLMSAGVWQLLDTPDNPQHEDKSVCKDDGPLSDLYAETRKQAKEMGWLTDIGNYDPYLATIDISAGDSESVTGVHGRIMSASPDGRAQILYQLQRRGQFEPFLKKLPWAYTKDIFDGLPGGHGQLKKSMEPYFLVEGKWGTSLEHREEHAPSLTSMIRGAGKRLGGIGEDVVDGFDTALNFMTFGFTHGYGQAQDLHNQGLINDGDYATAVRQVSTRAAVGMAILMATAGAGRGAGLAGGSSSAGASALNRGVAGTALATGVEGATFATTEMFALDTTDILRARR